MARYQYAGPGPVPGDDEIVRPGDIREYDQEPDWGPWELLDGPPEAAGLLRWNGEVTPPPDPPVPPPAVPVTPEGM